MLKIKIPVYYTKIWKRVEKEQTFLLSLNWYRNAHHFDQNKVKAYMHELLTNQLSKLVKEIPSPYLVCYVYYYASAVSDLPNVGPLASKWLNDTLQTLGLIKNDNVKHLTSELYLVGGEDKQNPRIEAYILPLENPCQETILTKHVQKGKPSQKMDTDSLLQQRTLQTQAVLTSFLSTMSKLQRSKQEQEQLT